MSFNQIVLEKRWPDDESWTHNFNENVNKGEDLKREVSR